VAIVSSRADRERLSEFRLDLARSLVAHALPELDVHFPARRESLAPLLRLYEPDVVLCWGYPWKLPPEALAVPRLGAVNQHPALLPRHRGPLPMAWALREGDPHFGVTWHRMDADLDTGPILAQTTVPILDDDTTIDEIGPRLRDAALGLLPRVFERLAAADPGDAQATEGASWAARFGADYADVDFSRTAREVHDQVRAWALSFGLSDVEGPIAKLDGERVKLLRTSLVERPGALRVECGDGPLWVLAHEPASRGGPTR
jgi:methionyl-tRNA formyltransferase